MNEYEIECPNCGNPIALKSSVTCPKCGVSLKFRSQDVSKVKRTIKKAEREIEKMTKSKKG